MLSSAVEILSIGMILGVAFCLIYFPVKKLKKLNVKSKGVDY